jgi:GNAT acetyltransferase-like protein
MDQTVLSQESRFSLDFAGDRWQLPELVGSWTRLVDARVNHDSLCQTPQYFEHLSAIDGPRSLSLLAVHAPDGRLAGVVPLHRLRWALPFEVSGRGVAASRFRAVEVLGSQPLVPDDPMLHDRVFGAVADAFPECEAVVMGSVPIKSFLWRYCETSRELRTRFLVYPYGQRSCHTIPLPATFEEYLARLSGKKRYNLRRQVRRLGEAVELRCIERPDDVPALAEAVAALGLPAAGGPDRSIPGAPVIEVEKFTDLAAHGLLLCYVLVSDGRPCAVTIGMKHAGTYQLACISHNHAVAALSPGSTLVFMLIEDLIRRHHIETIDFGFGEPAQPYPSIHVLEERASLLLFRKTLANRARRAAHAGFRAPIGLLKRWFRPPPPA